MMASQHLWSVWSDRETPGVDVGAELWTHGADVGAAFGPHGADVGTDMGPTKGDMEPQGAHQTQKYRASCIRRERYQRYRR